MIPLAKYSKISLANYSMISLAIFHWPKLVQFYSPCVYKMILLVECATYDSIGYIRIHAYYGYVCILQEIAIKETFVEQRVRVGLHCIVGGLMYLLCCIIDVPKLHHHVETVSTHTGIHGTINRKRFANNHAISKYVCTFLVCFIA